MQPLTFCHIGGEVFWRSAPGKLQPIDDAQVDGLRAIYFDEIKAALTAKDYPTADHAQDLLKQLTDARTALRTWRRLFNPERRAA